MKKLVLLLMATLLLTGCVKQTTTVTINDNASAVVKKDLNLGASVTEGSIQAEIGQRFLDNARKQNPVSLLKSTKDGEVVYTSVVKYDDVIKNDVFANETFFTPVNKSQKTLNCKSDKKRTTCTADFVAKIESEEIKKVLDENGLTYSDLDPYVLVMNLPVVAESHNANFFDLEAKSYIWEIPAGQEIPVKLKFNF